VAGRSCTTARLRPRFLQKNVADSLGVSPCRPHALDLRVETGYFSGMMIGQDRVVAEKYKNDDVRPVWCLRKVRFFLLFCWWGRSGIYRRRREGFGAWRSLWLSVWQVFAVTFYQLYRISRSSSKKLLFLLDAGGENLEEPSLPLWAGVCPLGSWEDGLRQKRFAGAVLVLRFDPLFGVLWLKYLDYLIRCTCTNQS
jgi:hypothetical protein